LPQSDGYDDPEFHFGITVSSVVPEPSTELLLGAGLLGILALRMRGRKTGRADV